MKAGDRGIHVTNGTRYLILSGPFVGRHGHLYVWARTVYSTQLGARFRLAAEKVRVVPEGSPEFANVKGDEP